MHSRYSLIITLASAATSLAGPLQTRQSKKPFIESNPACDEGPANRPNLPEDSEGCLGTLTYCTYKFYAKFGESHDSPKACYQAREQPPFKEPDENNPDCHLGHGAWSINNAKTEGCLGTVEYCNQRLYEGTAESYDNPDQCIAARRGTKPKPGLELPTEAELCPPFNGDRDACIAATRLCLGEHKDKKDIVECVHAAAAAA